jgi:hypothetical protein
MYVHILLGAGKLLLTLDGQLISQRLNLDFLWLHARQRNAAEILLRVLVYIRFDGGCEIERCLEGKLLLEERLHGQHAVKNVVEILSKFEKIAQEIVTEHQIRHTAFPSVALFALQDKQQLGCRAAAGIKVKSGRIWPVRRNTGRFDLGFVPRRCLGSKDASRDGQPLVALHLS